MRPLSHTLALRLFLAAIGLTSTIGQLVLVRELTAVFYGNELVLGLILATWLAWVAVGASKLAHIVSPNQDPRTCSGPRHHRDPHPGASCAENKSRAGQGILAPGLTAAALLLPVEVALVRGCRGLLGMTPGALVPLGTMVLAILLLLAPLCLLLGLLFTLGARAVVAAGGSASSAYVAESLGAVVGGALFSFGLVRWLTPFQVALGLGAFDLAMAALLARRTDGSLPRGLMATYPRGRWLWGIIAATLALSTPLFGSWLEQATLSWQYDGLRFARDSVYGRIAVVGRGEQRVFFQNGMLFFETQGVSAEETAHLPLLSHPDPRRVLLIGGGVSGTLAEIQRHPSVQALYYVELDPLIITAARSELPPDQVRALDDPRVTLVYTDGRAYVDRQARSLSLETFDVIVLDLPEPATGQLNRFYTQTFFARVRQILAPGGLFALNLPWQENYPDSALQRLGSSVYRTLQTEFSTIVPLPGERLFLLASDQPLVTDPAILSARLLARGIETRWVVPSYLDYLYTNDRVAQAHMLLEAPAHVRLNRDMEPVCYFYDLMVWLSRFYGAGSGEIISRGWLWGAIVIVLLGTLFLLRRWAVPAAVGFIGLAEMALEVVILFAFQVVHGFVYGQIGVIVTAFMAGLSAGGAMAGRWHWRDTRPRPRWNPRHSPRATLLWLQGSMVLLALAFPSLLALSSPPVWVFPLLALLAGGLAGLAFPVALACLHGPRGRTVGAIYGADLVGGCVGSVLVSALLVPVLGIPQTCMVVALASVVGLLVLL